MKTKYEIKYYDFKNKKKPVVNTDSFIEFITLRLTKEVIYYKVSYEDRFEDYLI